MIRDDAPQHDIDEAISDLEYRAELGIRYHQRRRRFFDSTRTALQVMSIFGSSGAVATYFAAGAADWVKIGFITALALGQAIALAVRPDEKAREHTRFAMAFADCDRSLKTLPAATPAAVRDVTHQLLSIEREEPPTRKVLMAMVRNDYARRVGSRERVPVSRLQAALANFVDLGGNRLESR